MASSSSFSISYLNSRATYATSGSRSLLSAPLSTPSQTSAAVDDAATVSISSEARAKRAASNRATRTLSDASSYVSIAESAASEISNLLEKAANIADTLANSSVTATQRSALSEEGKALLDEITTVNNKATFNDASVVNRGTQVFSVTFNPGSESSDQDYSITVANVALSKSNLGVSSLTSSSFSSSPSTTLSTIQAAQEAVSSTETTLEISANQISEIAKSYGMSIDSRYTLTKESALDVANSIGNSLANNLPDTLSALTNGLKPITLTDLIDNNTTSQA